MTELTFQPPADIGLEPVVPVSQATLAQRLARLRRRSGFQVTDRTLLVLGSVLLPLGAVFVLLGWYGASHTTRVWEEIPYLISGGILGLVLSIAGGFCYFGYFLARILATSRELLDVMLRIEDRLDAAPLSSPTAVDAPQASSRPLRARAKSSAAGAE
ncbi:MAG: hypothetical protein QOH64_2328 [Acidimicrobiaceae bacterium]|jgi:hypothetical protein